VLQFALLLLATGNVGHIPALNLGDREAPVNISDLGVALVLCTGALATFRAQSLRLSNTALAALAFVAIGGLSAVAAIPRFGLTPFEVIASLAYLARWTVYFAVYVIVINCVRAADVGRIWRALEWMMVAFAAFGIVQAIFLPNFAQMVYPDSRLYYDSDPQGHRLMSTVLEPNVAAAMILTVLLVHVGQLAAGARVRFWKPALLLVALVLTLSRSGALAFVVGVLVILALRGGLSKRMLRFFGVATIAAIAALPQLIAFGQKYEKFGLSDSSAMARVITLQRAVAVFLDSPWFGIGFNTFGFVMEHRGVERLGGSSYSSEGGLLFVAVMTGIVGLAVFCTMLWLALRKCRSVWRDWNATPEERGMCIGTAAATVAVCIHSLFVNSLMTPFVMEPLWVLWGLAFVVATSLRDRQAQRSAG
jgi:O-antigen ligase